ncbi:adenine-specific methyltransferase EcoRI family protein [Caproicibacterium sp. NSD3]
MNFSSLGLKELIATCYATSPIVYTQLTLFGKETFSCKEDSKKKPYKIEIMEVADENCDVWVIFVG